MKPLQRFTFSTVTAHDHPLVSRLLLPADKKRTVVRDVYGDAELESGTILSQRDRNATLATVALRAGYEISPALRPFVERLKAVRATTP